MAKVIKPWEQKWVEVTGVLDAGGGQGKTRAVRRASAPDSQICVLKVLNRQDDPERRRRMYREVAALRTLAHPGIPTLVDSNADQFNDLNVGLYLVTDYVPGPTISQYLQQKEVELAAALSITSRLVDIVQYCHERDTVHRDIKPDNIILRADHSPVLLDFGLSFNQSEEQETITFASQQLGNRFLHLPELLHESANRRDPRSDITQCCGVLFYLLTGFAPIVLSDQDGRKPHERAAASGIFPRIQEPQRTLLVQFFDTGFENDIGLRFQSSKALGTALQLIIEGKMDNRSDLERRLAEIRNAIKTNPEYRQNEQTQKLHQRLRELVNKACEVVNKGVGGRLGFTVSIAQADKLQFAPFYFEVTRHVHHELLTGRATTFQVLCGLAGEEYVLSGHSKKQTEELARIPVQGPVNWDAVETKVSEFVAGAVQEIFAQ
jgi:serine/threonine-protein kinase